MKIIVIGGTGLIGSKVVANLRQLGHEVVAGAPSTGINTVTGEGLAEALQGAQVVVDVANAPSWEEKAVVEFFQTAGRNLLDAEVKAGVLHHVALSVVGSERLTDFGYFWGKLAQEKLIKEAQVPYTIVRATQFFEFLGGIAQSGVVGDAVHLPPAAFQPMAADDVARFVTEAALAPPVNGTYEVAGPERVGMAQLVQRYFTAIGDSRAVVPDQQASYFGIKVDDQSLTPGERPRLGPTPFETWVLSAQPQK